jgi:hypothetical protein
MIFYLGMHLPYLAGNFENTFVSVNVLRKRKSNFPVNNWIMDSGAFTEISTFGAYRTPVEDYAKLIDRWSLCGNMQLAVSQDYMCEPFILQKTGLTVEKHQKLTIERYTKLLKQNTLTTIMPVLQGYEPQEYVNHLKMYGSLLKENMRVGVGSVCKRNSKPQQIAKVLETIKNERPDLRLHGFGLKTTALLDNYVESLLYSADSMAWSYAARREHKNPNGLKEATEFEHKIVNYSGTKEHQFSF